MVRSPLLSSTRSLTVQCVFQGIMKAQEHYQAPFWMSSVGSDDAETAVYESFILLEFEVRAPSTYRKVHFTTWPLLVARR